MLPALHTNKYIAVTDGYSCYWLPPFLAEREGTYSEFPENACNGNEIPRKIIRKRKKINKISKIEVQIFYEMTK